VLALGGADVDLERAQLAFGLGDVGVGALQGQARLVVFLTGEDLAGDDAVAFLHQHFADHAAAAGRDLDDAALDIDLAVGDGRIGALDAGGRGLFFLGLLRLAGTLDEGEAGDDDGDQHKADPEPFVLEEGGHGGGPEAVQCEARVASGLGARR